MMDTQNNKKSKGPARHDLFDRHTHTTIPNESDNSSECEVLELNWYQCKCLVRKYRKHFSRVHDFYHKPARNKQGDVLHVRIIDWHTVLVSHPTDGGRCCLWNVSAKSDNDYHKDSNEAKHRRFVDYFKTEIDSHRPPRTNKVFIVHGRDHRDRDYIAGMLYEWGLEPVILGFTPVDGSPNILTALKQLMSDVDFGIVIETPDDADGKLRDGVAENDFISDIEDAITREQRTLAKIADSDLKKKRRKSMLKETMKKLDELIAAKHKAKKRLKGQQDSSYTARPNVLLELGMLIGMLGEDNVVRLRKRHENFVMPSDLEGAMRIEYDAIDRRDKMYSLWEKLVLRGFVVKRFDMAGRTQDSIVEKFHSRQEGVIMPGDKIGKNKAYF